MEHIASEGYETTTEEFCKQHKIPVNDFVDHLGQFEDADEEIWQTLMQVSIDTAIDDPQFQQFDFRQRLLSVYYLFFENCAMNTAFCMASIEHHGKLKMVSTLSGLKKVFVAFIMEAYQSDSIFQSTQVGQLIHKIGDTIYSEGFYSQLLFLLDFWHRDTSPDFEKTDLAIEKSVKAACDLLDVTPVKSIFDFGKFIWQERIQK